MDVTFDIERITQEIWNARPDTLSADELLWRICEQLKQSGYTPEEIRKRMYYFETVTNFGPDEELRKEILKELLVNLFANYTDVDPDPMNPKYSVEQLNELLWQQQQTAENPALHLWNFYTNSWDGPRRIGWWELDPVNYFNLSSVQDQSDEGLIEELKSHPIKGMSIPLDTWKEYLNPEVKPWENIEGDPCIGPLNRVVELHKQKAVIGLVDEPPRTLTPVTEQATSPTRVAVPQSPYRSPETPPAEQLQPLEISKITVRGSPAATRKRKKPLTPTREPTGTPEFEEGSALDEPRKKRKVETAQSPLQIVPTWTYQQSVSPVNVPGYQQPQELLPDSPIAVTQPQPTTEVEKLACPICDRQYVPDPCIPKPYVPIFSQDYENYKRTRSEALGQVISTLDPQIEQQIKQEYENKIKNETAQFTKQLNWGDLQPNPQITPLIYELVDQLPHLRNNRQDLEAAMLYLNAFAENPENVQFFYLIDDACQLPEHRNLMCSICIQRVTQQAKDAGIARKKYYKIIPNLGPDLAQLASQAVDEYNFKPFEDPFTRQMVSRLLPVDELTDTNIKPKYLELDSINYAAPFWYDFYLGKYAIKPKSLVLYVPSYELQVGQGLPIGVIEEYDTDHFMQLPGTVAEGGTNQHNQCSFGHIPTRAVIRPVFPPAVSEDHYESIPLANIFPLGITPPTRQEIRESRKIGEILRQSNVDLLSAMIPLQQKLDLLTQKLNSQDLEYNERQYLKDLWLLWQDRIDLIAHVDFKKTLIEVAKYLEKLKIAGKGSSSKVVQQAMNMDIIPFIDQNSMDEAKRLMQDIYPSDVDPAMSEDEQILLSEAIAKLQEEELPSPAAPGALLQTVLNQEVDSEKKREIQIRVAATKYFRERGERNARTAEGYDAGQMKEFNNAATAIFAGLYHSPPVAVYTLEVEVSNLLQKGWNAVFEDTGPPEDPAAYNFPDVSIAPEMTIQQYNALTLGEQEQTPIIRMTVDQFLNTLTPEQKEQINAMVDLMTKYVWYEGPTKNMFRTVPRNIRSETIYGVPAPARETWGMVTAKRFQPVIPQQRGGPPPSQVGQTPTRQPGRLPTYTPPTSQIIPQPTRQPTLQPTRQPARLPTYTPPTSQIIPQPTRQPTRLPTYTPPASQLQEWRIQQILEQDMLPRLGVWFKLYTTERASPYWWHLPNPAMTDNPAQWTEKINNYKNPDGTWNMEIFNKLAPANPANRLNAAVAEDLEWIKEVQATAQYEGEMHNDDFIPYRQDQYLLESAQPALWTWSQKGYKRKHKQMFEQLEKNALEQAQREQGQPQAPPESRSTGFRALISQHTPAPSGFVQQQQQQTAEKTLDDDFKHMFGTSGNPRNDPWIKFVQDYLKLFGISKTPQEIKQFMIDKVPGIANIFGFGPMVLLSSPSAFEKSEEGMLFLDAIRNTALEYFGL